MAYGQNACSCDALKVYACAGPDSYIFISISVLFHLFSYNYIMLVSYRHVMQESRN